MTKNREKSSSSQLGFGGGGVDRISNLPDSIIHHILSFLHTKSAVQTSLLSKQWESTWKHVHALNVELDFDEYSRYETFVDKLLSLRYPLHVSKLLVLWNLGACPVGPDDCKFSLLRRLVQYAVSHGAQHFNIRHIYAIVPNISLLQLFHSISDNVRTLRSVCFDLDCRPVCSGFQLLTTLALVSCRFLTDQELVEPFSQFPCLNDLVLDDCWWVSEADDDRSVRLRVSGIEFGRLSLLAIDVFKCEIFAPKLKYFKLLPREIIIDFSELTLPSLVHADIQSLWVYTFLPNYVIDKQRLVFMFHGLNNVESLTLCREICEAVRLNSEFLEQQPCPFTKLKKLNLEFGSSYNIPCKVLNRYFLEGCYDARLNVQILDEESRSVTIECQR